MTTYHGPATLLFNGDEHPVQADLRYDLTGRLPSWQGSITADPGLVWAVFDGSENQRLRLPDGREGEFMPWRSAMESDTLEIKGSGPAPF